MNTYRNETESQTRNVETLKEELSIANDKIDELNHELKNPPFFTQVRQASANLIPFLIIVGVVSVILTLGINISMQESSVHKMKRNLAAQCISGGGNLQRLDQVSPDDVLVCYGGTANGQTL